MQASAVLRDAVKKPISKPSLAKCSPLTFTYESSPSGVDSNLLILLHGLGDTHLPFQNLGRKLAGNLPQTAILSLRGGSPIPFLDQEGWAWWPVWDDLGQEISSPDLRPFLQAFDRLVGYLTQNCEQGGCGWPSTALHLFGFGQGASAALEGVLNWSRSGTEADAKIQEINENQKFLRVAERQFGSVVSICGQLLSHPTTNLNLKTPVLYFDRQQANSLEATKREKLIQRAFANVTNVVFPSSAIESMPSSKSEWDAIMLFWSRLIRNRNKWELEGQLYSVDTAISSS